MLLMERRSFASSPATLLKKTTMQPAHRYSWKCFEFLAFKHKCIWREDSSSNYLPSLKTASKSACMHTYIILDTSDQFLTHINLGRQLIFDVLLSPALVCSFPRLQLSLQRLKESTLLKHGDCSRCIHFTALNVQQEMPRKRVIGKVILHWYALPALTNLWKTQPTILIQRISMS